MWPEFSRLAFHGYLDENGGDGDDQGGDGKGDDKGEDKGTPQGDPRVDQLTRAVGMMAQGQNQLTQGLADLASKIEQIGQSGRQKEGSSGSGDEDVDFETMDRKTFAVHLMSQLKGALTEAVKPLNDKFGQLDEKIDGQSLSVLIKDFSKDHPDFFEWRNEIRELAKENPTLTPARLYTLARSEDDGKSKKMDEKYGLNKVPQKNGNDILSLFPSSTGGSSATKGAGKMSPTQAAEKAWDEVMSQIPPPS